MKSQAPIPRLNLPIQIFQALLSQKLVHLMGCFTLKPWVLDDWMIGWLPWSRFQISHVKLGPRSASDSVKPTGNST